MSEICDFDRFSFEIEMSQAFIESHANEFFDQFASEELEKIILPALNRRIIENRKQARINRRINEAKQREDLIIKHTRSTMPEREERDLIGL